MKSISHTSFKKRIAASFGAKAAGYNEYAVFQTQILDRLIPIIIDHSKDGGLWLDAGCGNGILERRLAHSQFGGRLVALDFSLQSLRYGRKHHYPASLWICADIDAAPFKTAAFHGIIVTSVLQWMDEPGSSLAALSSLLEPGGFCVFSIFNDKSFNELNEIRRRFGLPQPIRLPDLTAIGSYLASASLTTSGMESFESTMYFPSAWHLLKHLSAIGSTSIPSGRMSRKRLTEFCTMFEDTFATDKGVPLTYAAYAGAARKELTDV